MLRLSPRRRFETPESVPETSDRNPWCAGVTISFDLAQSWPSARHDLCNSWRPNIAPNSEYARYRSHRACFGDSVSSLRERASEVLSGNQAGLAPDAAASRIPRNKSARSAFSGSRAPAWEPEVATKLFDTSLMGGAQKALDFIGNVLEASTEYSVIARTSRARSCCGTRARAACTATSPEVVASPTRRCSTPPRYRPRKPRAIMEAALRDESGGVIGASARTSAAFRRGW
jgi:hypothetical protein